MPSTLQLRVLSSTTTMSTSMITTTTSTASTSMAAAEMLPSLAEELARELSVSCQNPDHEMSTVAKYHNHYVGPTECCSAVVRRISAPVSTVWSFVGRFDNPQTYKHFLRSCRIITGDGDNVGCLREVHVISGLPAASATERLEIFDEERHTIGFRVVGGEHRLQNYRSVTTLHPSATADGGEGTVVIESYVVGVPQGNTKEDTCVFVDTIVRCNHQNLAQIAERMAARSSSSSSKSNGPSSGTSSSSSCKVS